MPQVNGTLSECGEGLWSSSHAITPEALDTQNMKEMDAEGVQEEEGN